MCDVDSQKLKLFLVVWLAHEYWIQGGCKDSDRPDQMVPGYNTLTSQDLRAYDLYRHTLVPYLAKSQGFAGLHDDLQRMVDDARMQHPVLLERLVNAFENPPDRFRVQWGNLFGNMFYDDLSHQTLQEYQRKFEVELPLCFLANLREIVSEGILDLDLNRFRDRVGNLKKGVVAQFIKDGLPNYPVLEAVANRAYHVKLRNAVSHNAYRLDAGEVRALDNSFVLSRSKFLSCFGALQVLQNAVVWLFMISQRDISSLESKGVLAIGWVCGGGGAETVPQVIIYQLAPFCHLDRSSAWFQNVLLEERDGRLVTRLGDSSINKGEITREMRGLIDRMREFGEVHCTIIPVMPCVHSHEGIDLAGGEFCQVADTTEKVVPISWVT